LVFLSEDGTLPGSLCPESARLEPTGFGLIGLAGVFAAFPLVNRRRPQ
jgi:hypothetical protein